LVGPSEPATEPRAVKVDINTGLTSPGFLERVVDVQLDVVVGHTVDDAQQVPLAGGRLPVEGPVAVAVDVKAVRRAVDLVVDVAAGPIIVVHDRVVAGSTREVGPGLDGDVRQVVTPGRAGDVVASAVEHAAGDGHSGTSCSLDIDVDAGGHLGVAVVSQHCDVEAAAGRRGDLHGASGNQGAGAVLGAVVVHPVVVVINGSAVVVEADPVGVAGRTGKCDVDRDASNVRAIGCGDGRRHQSVNDGNVDACGNLGVAVVGEQNDEV